MFCLTCQALGKFVRKFNYLGQNDKKDVDSVANYRLYTYDVLCRKKQLTGNPYSAMAPEEDKLLTLLHLWRYAFGQR
jgi:hypothetical protein